MQAARWDSVMERGGAWRMVVRRDAAMSAPCSMAVYAITGNGRQGNLMLAVPGQLDDGATTVTFIVPHDQTEELAAGPYEYRVTVGDPELAGLVVLLRGYLVVRDSLTDYPEGAPDDAGER